MTWFCNSLRKLFPADTAEYFKNLWSLPKSNLLTHVIILVNTCIQQYLYLFYTAGLSWESLSTFQSVYSLYITQIQVSQPKQTSTWRSVSESDMDSVTALTDSTSSSSKGFIILIQTSSISNDSLKELACFWINTCHVTHMCVFCLQPTR